MNKPSLKHVSLTLLCVYLIRSLVLNSITLTDALTFGILAALTAFYELQLESNKIKELYKRMEQLEKNDKDQEAIILDTRNIISTVKMSSVMGGLRK